ncbi:hypothetical protein X975_19470, partial [Stegodyphus mimosarum]
MNSFKAFQSISNLAAVVYNGPITPLLMYKGEYSITIQLESPNGNIAFTSVYILPSYDTTLALTELEYIVALPVCSKIVAGDFNGTSPLLGKPEGNRRAVPVLDFITSY